MTIIDAVLNSEEQGKAEKILGSKVAMPAVRPDADRLNRLVKIVFADTELQEVVRAWPEMSPQARTICKKLAGLLDGR